MMIRIFSIFFFLTSVFFGCSSGLDPALLPLDKDGVINLTAQQDPELSPGLMRYADLTAANMADNLTSLMKVLAQGKENQEHVVVLPKAEGNFELMKSLAAAISKYGSDRNVNYANIHLLSLKHLADSAKKFGLVNDRLVEYVLAQTKKLIDNNKARGKNNLYIIDDSETHLDTTSLQDVVKTLSAHGSVIVFSDSLDLKDIPKIFTPKHLTAAEMAQVALPEAEKLQLLSPEFYKDVDATFLTETIAKVMRGFVRVTNLHNLLEIIKATYGYLHHKKAELTPSDIIDAVKEVVGAKYSYVSTRDIIDSKILDDELTTVDQNVANDPVFYTKKVERELSELIAELKKQQGLGTKDKDDTNLSPTAKKN